MESGATAAAADTANTKATITVAIKATLLGEACRWQA